MILGLSKVTALRLLPPVSLTAAAYWFAEGWGEVVRVAMGVGAGGAILFSFPTHPRSYV